MCLLYIDEKVVYIDVKQDVVITPGNGAILLRPA
jgi:hypothetical protein